MSNSEDAQFLAGFAQRLRMARQVLGLTVAELSRRMGCSASAIYHYERGDAAPNAVWLRDFRKVSATDLEWLVLGPPPRDSNLAYGVQQITKSIDACKIHMEDAAIGFSELHGALGYWAQIAEHDIEMTTKAAEAKKLRKPPEAP